MCSCDAEPASVMTVTIRHARKPHRCCECAGEILPGQPYEYVSGIWQGQADSYKTCIACAEDRKALKAPWRCIPFGALLDCYAEEVGWKDVWACLDRAREAEHAPQAT